jgi:hypothetical protein
VLLSSLPVPSFGGRASELLERELALAGAQQAAGLLTNNGALLRREAVERVREAVGTDIAHLFQEQVAIVEQREEKAFKRELLREYRLDRTTGGEVERAEGRGNADILKRALESHARATADLAVPALGLERSQDAFRAKLTRVLEGWADSPAAKIKATRAVKKTVSKPKPPSERGVTPSLHLVAMLRPDGFGSFSGFAGFNPGGGHSVTVGVCNDADSPEVLAQFGGLRPPLIRVQPKINLDVDL